MENCTHQNQACTCTQMYIQGKYLSIKTRFKPHKKNPRSYLTLVKKKIIIFASFERLLLK